MGPYSVAKALLHSQAMRHQNRVLSMSLCLHATGSSPGYEAYGVIATIQRLPFPVLPPSGVKQPHVLEVVPITCTH